MPDRTPTMKIGLVGHRRNDLSMKEFEELPARLRTLFAEIALAAGQMPVVLLTGMADGADLVGAAVRPSGWSLVAILTQTPEALATRMDSADAAELLRLCADPGAILELLPGPVDDYHAQAGIIISRAELLIALWDGQPGRGPGGTADSILRAQALGRTVVILPAAGGPARWMGGRPSAPVDAAAIRDMLRERAD